MMFSRFQKVTIVSCAALCLALLLPKMLLSDRRRDAPHKEGGMVGHFPPMVHKSSASDGNCRSGRHFSRPQNHEASARTKSAGAGSTTGGKPNLAGQIIPVYGFGILMYVLYILFKITSKGNTSQASGRRFNPIKSERGKRKITEFETAQLQDKLNETKDVIERIIMSATLHSHRVGVDDERMLLDQLTEISRVMHEGQFVDADPPDTQDCCCAHAWKDKTD